jgi:hypothetical protein
MKKPLLSIRPNNMHPCNQSLTPKKLYSITLYKLHLPLETYMTTNLSKLLLKNIKIIIILSLNVKILKS